MSKLTLPVAVDMDSSRIWHLETNPERTTTSHHGKPTLIISQELFDEYNTARIKWSDVQDKLEQLWRVQAGLKTWEENDLPEHEVIR